MNAFYASYVDDWDDGSAYAWREEEEAYAEYMRAGMAARRRKRLDENNGDDDDPRRRRRDSAAEAQARAARERDEAAQRVLDEERRKDAEWRERTARRATRRQASSSVFRFRDVQARWGIAAAKADRGESIAYADVPWPFDPESRGRTRRVHVRDVLLGPGSRVADAARRALDRRCFGGTRISFSLKGGSRVASEDVERTRLGVNAVAGVIASLFRRSAGS